MVLKPAKMSRERIIIHKDMRSSAITALHDLGVMQIEQLPESIVKVLDKADDYDYKELGDYDQKFRSLEAMLYRYEPREQFAFSNTREVLEKAKSIKITERVVELTRQMSALSASINEDNGRLALLKKMPHTRHDLSIFSTEMVVSFVVSGRDLQRFNSEAHAKIKDCVLVKGEYSTIISMEKQGEKEFGSYVRGLKVDVEAIPKMNGSITENEKALEEAANKKKADYDSLKAELNSISEIYYPLVSAIREELDLEMEKAEVVSKFGFGSNVVAFEGWVPESEVQRLRSTLKRITNDAFIMEKIHTKEIPPTKLVNPVTAKLYEFFIRFYSLPKSNEFDPTLIFAIVFPIFFGFMIGDVGYGAIMLLGSIWLIHRLKNPPKKSRIPGKVSKFVHTIISDNGLSVLARSIMPGAVIAIVLGIIFNEYFGFQLPYTAIFSVETGLPTLLLISGWIGVAMVSFGFILGFLNNLAIGHNKHAVGKIGWLMAAWGIVIFGLAVLHRQPLWIPNYPVVLAYFLLIGGIIIFLITEGFESLMELPSLISHILSYTRLIGILLASVILAQVIDFIFEHSLHSIPLAILGIFILIIGQLFNIAIALFEPGIQGARLIYVEFFSKFFTGNGNEFRPFASNRKRTISTLKNGSEMPLVEEKA
ncbi:MAG: V-type ATP synthase subunit I [Candidatus Marsarchaeota archaeon]|nr:V-type ATP synthase subunit I [Candidatus Marsarchaeota archaeon]